MGEEADPSSPAGVRPAAQQGCLLGPQGAGKGPPAARGTAGATRRTLLLWEVFGQSAGAPTQIPGERGKHKLGVRQRAVSCCSHL